VDLSARKRQDARIIYIMRNFIVCIRPHKHSDDKIGRTRSTHGREDICIKMLVEKPEDLGVEGRIILKWISNRKGGCGQDSCVSV
jgi:hypothetical protein